MSNEQVTNHPLLSIYRLMKRLYLLEMGEVMEKWGLTRMELDVLLFLDANAPMDTAAEIVAQRNLTKSHVSSAVDHLTRMGYLQQHRDEKNRRRIHLLLTEEAQPILIAGRDAQNRFTETLYTGMTNEEIVTFHTLLERVSKNAGEKLEGADE